MATSDLITTLDASVMTLSGGTQTTAAIWVEGMRHADEATVRAALAKGASEAEAGPLRDWMAAHAG